MVRWAQGQRVNVEDSRSLPATGTLEADGESSMPTINPVPPELGSLRDIDGVAKVGPAPASLET